MTVDDLHREAYPTNLGAFLANCGVQPNADIVVEKKDFENITIVQLQKQGQYTLQSQREFPFPLLPTFSDLDRSHVLVRRLASLTMPYASSLAATDAARSDPNLEVTPLVRSSSDGIATRDDLALSPPQLQRQLPALASNGPHATALVLKGTFTSAFKGQPAPPRGDAADDGRDAPKPADRPFRESGHGRLLVIGSSLGLENLSSERVFEGFTMAQLTSGTADFFLKMKDYVANFQNWQLRLSQLAPVIQANLDFVFNALDWGVQNEALVDIRTKGYVKRPIATLAPAWQTTLTLGLVVGLPLLFAAFGVIRSATRRRKG
jgi:ABC-type uncharacterized transport system involved in gliding motility auxiliary subunit